MDVDEELKVYDRADFYGLHTNHRGRKGIFKTDTVRARAQFNSISSGGPIIKTSLRGIVLVGIYVHA